MNSESDERSDSQHTEFALDIGDEFLEDEEENGFIEWDDEEEEKSEVPHQTVCANVDWEAVNKSLQEDSQKGKSKRRKLSKDEKKRNLLLHQSHLVLLMASGTEWHATSCKHNLLRALLASIVPAKVRNEIEAIALKLQHLCRFYNQKFSLVESQSNGHSDLDEATFLHAFSERKGTRIIFHLLFLVLCRSIGYYCRLVVALDAYQIDLKASENIILRDPESDFYAPCIWIEVWNSDTNQWTSCDVAKNTVLQQNVSEILPRKSISYVLSFDQISGLAVDVTARYVHSWSKIMQLRHGHEFFSELVEAYNKRISETTPKDTSILAQIEQEKIELQQAVDAESMPTSVERFRRHRRYCLERHLGRLEVLHPRKPAGIFKGQSVFLRCHIQKLQSARLWLRQGRIIKEEEKNQPIKQLTRKRDTRKGYNDTQQREVALYGRWQTDAFVPPIVVDGIVPKNEHGNIELWSEHHLPVGATHLRMRHITSAASKLGIDYAPALIGFETKNGMNYPKFDGIIVASSHEQLLIDAQAHLEQEKIEHAIKRNQNLIHKRWKRLVQRLLIRNRLEVDYGKI
uniref:DNA repair protein putative n=1 Tax=Albugo laibachii Nc14 TaxID=890382 RepID=F0W8D5_9STRA|nr:DNA repair protein putative [Albugo laibachii Nc14]CCA24369.1 DNA repair protein putative [Albugo laibachii Nc14]|eukprot:CCA24369.1 DNA repair protein putative [Albugo laibachii Nc14]